MGIELKPSGSSPSELLKMSPGITHVRILDAPIVCFVWWADRFSKTPNCLKPCFKSWVEISYVIELLVKNADQKVMDQVYDALVTGRFVDDIASGAQTQERRKSMIEQVDEVLTTAGFKKKFVALSGEDPLPEASTNGITMKVLGYNWTPKDDIFSRSLGEVNFNKKKRGTKAPNTTPVVTLQDVSEVMDPLGSC